MADPHAHPPLLDPQQHAPSNTDVGELEQLESNKMPTHAEITATQNPADDEAFILRLPNELLIKIMEIVVFDPSDPSDYRCEKCNFQHDFSSTEACCLVSSSFRDIAQPLFFRKMILYTRNATFNLYRVLSGNAHIRECCRTLSIEADPYVSEYDPRVWKDLTFWLRHARCMHLCGWEGCQQDYDVYEHYMMRTHRLEHLSLYGGYWGNYLTESLNEAMFPQLKTLFVDCGDYGYCSPRFVQPWTLDLEKHRTSPLRSLIIEQEQKDLKTTALLLAWPKALVNFKFKVNSHCGLSKGSLLEALPMLNSSLSAHSETLKSVDICITTGNVYNFDATLYPSLRFLKLSRWQMGEPLRFTPEHAKILGPRLKTFVWDFDSLKYQTCCGEAVWAHDFSDNEKAWLRQLATAAIGSALQEIHIMFTPDTCVEEYIDFARENEYPWDIMDDVRDTIMRPNGMNLKYSEPAIARDEWEYDCETETDPGSYSRSEDTPTESGEGHGNLRNISFLEEDPTQTTITSFFPTKFHYTPKQKKITDFFPAI